MSGNVFLLLSHMKDPLAVNERFISQNFPFKNCKHGREVKNQTDFFLLFLHTILYFYLNNMQILFLN